MEPDYAEVVPSLADLQLQVGDTLSIDAAAPEEVALWGFLTITNNRTQEITVISPQYPVDGGMP